MGVGRQGRWHLVVAGADEPFHKDNSKFLLLNQHLSEVITVAQTEIQFKGGIYNIY